MLTADSEPAHSDCLGFFSSSWDEEKLCQLPVSKAPFVEAIAEEPDSFFPYRRTLANGLAMVAAEDVAVERFLYKVRRAMPVFVGFQVPPGREADGLEARHGTEGFQVQISVLEVDVLKQPE